ncbi:UNVERIFIED_CONTAM: PHD and RING finger domain-containing protein 1 [Sesamum indicum]
MCPESSDASPNKRIKTITPPPHSPPSLISKGKSKIQEGESLPIQAEAENESADCCGICLSEAGDAGVSRGYIDSCNHYFCFVCIMEWAKVESKCPLCKRRFSAIRRPPKPPIFASERIVHVPVRDQVCFASPFVNQNLLCYEKYLLLHLILGAFGNSVLGALVYWLALWTAE